MKVSPAIEWRIRCRIQACCLVKISQSRLKFPAFHVYRGARDVDCIVKVCNGQVQLFQTAIGNAPVVIGNGEISVAVPARLDDRCSAFD